jgi:hypothetical protein
MGTRRLARRRVPVTDPDRDRSLRTVTPLARLLVAALTLPAALAVAADPGKPQAALRFRPSGPGQPRATFEVVGLDPVTIDALARDPERWRQMFTVSTVENPGETQADLTDQPALLGTYEVDREAGVLRFRARFPTEPGVHYRAVYLPTGPGAAPLVGTFSVSKPAAREPTTRVVRVAPSRDVLPENLLKFYIEFSAPMSRGRAYENVHLLDAKGKPIDLPFLELGEELWDPRGVRFTLLFDPGRIKSGLKPREEAGPVLEAGKAYTLVVDRGWRDAAGDPLSAEFRKPFRVGPADTTPPDPKNWVLGRPEAGTRAPLVATFPEPLDRALLGRVLAVADSNRKPLSGRVEVGPDETSWSFTPDAPWTPGDHLLIVDRGLEDLVGNSIGRRFEVDVFNKIDEPGEPAATVELRFRVAGRQ